MSPPKKLVYYVMELAFSSVCLFMGLKTTSLFPFHTVHGVLEARTLEWFAILSSSAPCFVRTLHSDPFALGGPARHGS